MPTNAYFQKLFQLDQSLRQFPNQLCDFLDEREFDENLRGLRTSDLVEVIDYLDKVLDSLGPTDAASRRALQKLQEICTSRVQMPSSYVLPAGKFTTDKTNIASGGFSDVFRGFYNDREVCIKRLRVSSTGSSEKMLYREALIWKRLRHPNIVPFIGVTFNPLQIISEWMPSGNLTAYINSKPRADRVALLVGVAEGLKYLHKCDVVHGDLKGPNIMVDASERACITDFGLARNQGASEETTTSGGGTARWTAPEILQGQGSVSKEADVFSFAMVMIEAFTGSAPFDLHLSITVSLAIMRGDRPSRPAHPACTHKLWELMQSCWDQEIGSRPNMSEVVRVLKSPDSRTSSHKRTFSAPTKPDYSSNLGSQRRRGGDRAVSLMPSSGPPSRQQFSHPRGRLSSVVDEDLRPASNLRSNARTTASEPQPQIPMTPIPPSSNTRELRGSQVPAHTPNPRGEEGMEEDTKKGGCCC